MRPGSYYFPDGCQKITSCHFRDEPLGESLNAAKAKFSSYRKNEYDRSEKKFCSNTICKKTGHMNEEFTLTPPEIIEAAKEIEANLLPEK
ncbi:hypothetical protein NQ315_006621 [Exocentrus adspersus]|uniref:Uncharacterized protein n=1 Tax=Exocentrus adspersus TaxID=1586481 RepID=A0AAV8VE52_9CUCU|nr:hypothetical protein NQ315_006621 [Exocentrus adspersus]